MEIAGSSCSCNNTKNNHLFIALVALFHSIFRRYGTLIKNHVL